MPYKNKADRNARETIYRAANREAIRAYHSAWSRSRRSGYTPREYAAAITDQNGLCKLCQSPPTTVGLYADHCHETGIKRGLLCVRCNSGLGMFGDRAELLLRAVDYIKTGGWS